MDRALPEGRRGRERWGGGGGGGEGRERWGGGGGNCMERHICHHQFKVVCYSDSVQQTLYHYDAKRVKGSTKIHKNVHVFT